MKMTPVGRPFSWQSYNDETTSYEDTTFTTIGLLEQINTTRDVSDYLSYMTDVRIASDEGFLRGGEQPVLTVLSAGHALQVSVNDQLTASKLQRIETLMFGTSLVPYIIHLQHEEARNRLWITFSGGVNLRARVNRIALLSIAVGLPISSHLSWQPAISRTQDRTHIAQWVESIVQNGEVKQVVDPKLEGKFDVNCAWKAVELAMTCASWLSSRSPTMNTVLIELKECLGIEAGSHDTVSHNSLGIVSVDPESSLVPR